jgi:DNA-binding transcriptional ArsR family regulator
MSTGRDQKSFRAVKSPAGAPAGASVISSTWTFLSNHAHVLILLSQHYDESRAGELTIREIAQEVGITERAVSKIIGELEEGGFLTRRKEGRHNAYEIHSKQSLRHPVESHRTIKDLLLLGRK